MLKIGLVRLLSLVLVGLVIPVGVYRLSRLIGAPLLLLLAAAIGLGYGTLKADHPWSGDGLAANLGLMALNALALAASEQPA